MKRVSLIIFFSLLIVLSIVFPINVHMNFNTPGDQIPYELTKDKYEFIISPDGNNFDAIALRFGTYNLKQKGTINVKLMDDENIILNKKINMSQIEDNEFINFNFPVISNSKNKSFKLIISIEKQKKSTSIALWTKKGPLKDNYMVSDPEYAIDIQMMYDFKNKNLVWYTVTIFIIYVIYLVLDKKYKDN